MLAKRPGTRLFFILFILFAVWEQIMAQSSSKPILAVMPFKQNGLEDSDIDFIINLVSSVFVNTGRYKVLERWQIESILKEQEFSLTGCVDEECAIEAGKLLSANMVITGYLNNKGSERYYRVYGTLKLINVITSEIIRTVDVKFEGDYSDFVDYIKIRAYVLAQKSTFLSYVPKYFFGITTYASLGAAAFFGYQFNNYYQKYIDATDKYDMLDQKQKAQDNLKYMQYSGMALGASVILYWISNRIFSDERITVINYHNGSADRQIELAVYFRLR